MQRRHDRYDYSGSYEHLGYEYQQPHIGFGYNPHQYFENSHETHGEFF